MGTTDKEKTFFAPETVVRSCRELERNLLQTSLHRRVKSSCRVNRSQLQVQFRGGFLHNPAESGMRTLMTMRLNKIIDIQVRPVFNQILVKLLAYLRYKQFYV